MIYQVLDRLKVRTTQGVKELNPGQVITLSDDKALKLLNEGRIVPTENVAYRIYSGVLQTHLWVVPEDKNRKTLRDQGITEAIYTFQEVRELGNISEEALKSIHAIKEAFPHSTIEGSKRKVNQVN